MTNTIIIGNLISFVAAVLLGLSCWCKNPKRVFVYQFIENLFLSLSSIVFGSYSAAVSTLLSTVPKNLASTIKLPSAAILRLFATLPLL